MTDTKQEPRTKPVDALPTALDEVLARARHDPSAYRELNAANFVRLTKERAAPGVGTNAWGPEQTLPRKPAAMFALGADKLRELVGKPKSSNPADVTAAENAKRRLLNAVAGWHSNRSMILCGPTGVGKTAALVLLCMTKAGASWRWVDGYALGQCARRHALGDGDPEMIAMASRARILIVDDPDHAQDREPFIEVVRHRYDNRMPTLIATGKPYEGLEEHFGDAYRRRVEESCPECTVVDLHKAG